MSWNVGVPAETGVMLRFDHANDDHLPMTYWLSHGRLRVVLVFTQRYVVLLSVGSSGTSVPTTVLGTESGCGLLYLRRMPNVCVRHLGLLGYPESSRLSTSPSSKCDAPHLENHPSPLRLLKCTPCAMLLLGSTRDQPARLTKSPKSGYAQLERYIKTKIFTADALAQWTKDGWDFQPYRLNEGRIRAPKRYVNRRIKWRAIPNSSIPQEETVGYYAETSTTQ